MTRKTIDCRTQPSDSGCTLTISGEPDEVLPVAAHHAVTVHGHAESPELTEQLRGALADDTTSKPGAFIQLIDFASDRPDEWDAIVRRWEAAIGPDRTARWSLVVTDRDRPGHYLGIVEFPSYDAAMANSDHPATGKFVSELSAICNGEPAFRNLDVRFAYSH